MNDKIKVGLLCVGLDTYWTQFNGLLERLLGYKDQIKSSLEGTEVSVVDAGMVDTTAKAGQAAELFDKENVLVLFVYLSTYSLSSIVLPVVRRTKARIVLLNLQPTKSIDYNYINSLSDKAAMTGEWLANCQACSLPEMISVFNRIEIPYDLISGYLGETDVLKELGDWCVAVRVVKKMRSTRLGVLGNYYGGMLDVYTDLTRQSGAFGTHIQILEMCQLKKLRDELTDKEIDEKVVEFRKAFDVDSRCEESEIVRAAKTSVALDKLIRNNELGALAYYYEGEGDYQDIVTSLIAGNTLLTSGGIPIAGEYEVKNAQAMKILSEIGSGGSFSEFYAVDYDDDVVLLGHDGPAHTSIAEGKVELVPLPVYHGKPGHGLSIQMTVKHGDVTLLSVGEDSSGVYLVVAQGASVEGPVLNIGNTNSRYRFSIGAKDFVNQWSKAGPSHHCAIGVGHVGSIIEKIGRILDIRVVTIC